MFENAPRNKHRKSDGRQQTSIAQAGTIYSELKLSEQLTETLGQVRSQVSKLTSSLEYEIDKRIKLEDELKHLKLRYKQKEQELSYLKSHSKK